MTAPPPDAKALALAQARVALRSFLDSDCVLDCRPAGPPRVSVLLLVWNRAEMTLACLQALALRLNRIPYEIVVVDNGSADETGRLLDRVQGLKVIRNRENVGFPRGVNQAARSALGDYLLLLNNDAEVLGRSIDAAVDFLDADADAGAVGGKIVLLDGTLQEAGCTLCRDGWPYMYGRQGAPDDPAFDFRRDVDYCSAAFLMTPRELFARLGGLDERFSPGYFEDPDYCIRLWQQGRRVVYLPDATILHYESGSASAFPDRPGLMRRNHSLFIAKHAAWLANRPASDWPPLLLRTRDNLEFNVLLVGDAVVEDLTAEQALAALQEVVARLQALGGFVTLRLTGAVARSLRPLLGRLPKTVEVYCLEGADWNSPPSAAHYDLVVAGNAEAIRPLVSATAARPRGAVLRDGRFTALDAPADARPSGGGRRAA